MLVSTCAMCQTAFGARDLRHDIPWRIAWASVGVRLLGLMIGVFLLTRLVLLDRQTVQLVVGVILCVMVITQFLWKPRLRDEIHRGWATTAWLSSGLLSGLCGMGGPPVVLWSMSLNWSAHRTRGFLFVTLGAVIPVQLILLSMTFGAPILWNSALGLLLLPLIYVGSRLGLSIGRRIEKDRLRRLAYAVLLVMGVSAIAPALNRW